MEKSNQLTIVGSSLVGSETGRWRGNQRTLTNVRINWAREASPSLAKWSNFIRYESRKRKEGEGYQPVKESWSSHFLS